MTPEKWLTRKVVAVEKHYYQIISTVFPGVISTTEFIECFNDMFKNYQGTRAQKLAPPSIRQGYISCSSAAALMGIWFEQLSHQHPEFYIDFIHPLSGQSKASAHTVIGLPVPNQGVTLYEYKNSLKELRPEPNQLQGTYRIVGNKAYLTDRLRVFTVSSKDLQ